MPVAEGVAGIVADMTVVGTAVVEVEEAGVADKPDAVRLVVARETAGNPR